MLNGDSLWSDKITSDIAEVSVYGRTVRTYVPGPANLYETLRDTAQKYGDKTAIYAEDSNRYTFAQIHRLVLDLAWYLHSEYGVSKGSRVGLLLENGIDFITAFYAINRLGGVVVPLPGKFRRVEIEALVERADLSLVICQEIQAQWFPGLAVITTASKTCAYGLPLGKTAPKDNITEAGQSQNHSAEESLANLEQPGLEDDAILLFTSGTTSLSKGVILTNMNAVHAIRSYQRVLGLSDKDSTIIAVPIYHVTGMIAIIGLFIYLGGGIHVQKRMSGRPFVREIYASDVTFIHASPTVFALMLEQQEYFPQLPSVRMMACGAAHMPVSRIKALHEWMPNMEFRTVYGLTESCSPGFVFPVDAATSPYLGSSGMPIPGLDVKICQDGQEMPVGQTGEILLHGANIARRYDKITGAISQDGWLSTGDIGRINEAGYVYILDRKKDLINRGGEKIWCIDVEEELRRLPEIADAALVGVPDSTYGEVGAALLVLQPGATFDAASVRERLNTRLARYQIPVYYKVVPRIPLTAGGKVDKKSIRDLFSGEC